MAVRLDHKFSRVSYRALALKDDHTVQVVPDSELSVSGGDSGGETPVPIPNTAVKPSSADGTARSPCGRVGRRRIFSNGPEPRRCGRARSVLVAFCALAVGARVAAADQVTFPL